MNFSDPFGLRPNEADDCRIIKCPETAQDLANDPRTQEFADQLWQMSVDAGYKSEFGAHIVVNDAGGWEMVNVTRGTQNQVPGLPLAPWNAIAEIHTHPGVVYPGGGRSGGSPQPSGEDRYRANTAFVYGVTVAPTAFGVIPPGQDLWIRIPRP